jgi:hypothetical protein
MTCAGSSKLTLNGDRMGVATCRICGRGQLLHVKYQMRTGRTIGWIPLHTVQS